VAGIGGVGIIVRMTTGQERATRNPITLARRLIGGGVSLARLQADQAKAEMIENLGQLKGGMLRIVIAIAILVAVIIELLAFVMAVLVSAGLWWVALLLIVALIAVAVLLAWSGIKDVRSTNFKPEQTIASVKEDIEWAKNRLLRRG